MRGGSDVTRWYSGSTLTPTLSLDEGEGVTTRYLSLGKMREATSSTWASWSPPAKRSEM